MREIIQISASNHSLFALCDDGTVWQQGEGDAWLRISPIPQDKDRDTLAKPPEVPLPTVIPGITMTVKRRVE